MGKFKNYKAVGCPTCHVPPGARCIKLPEGGKLRVENWRDAPKVPYHHRARQEAYVKTHGREFKPQVVPMPSPAVTPVGNEVVSGTDRLNRLLGRTP